MKFKIFFPREFMDHHLQDLKQLVPVTSKRFKDFISQIKEKFQNM